MKLKQMIYSGAVLLAFTSCNDFLEQPPKNLLSSDDFYQTASQADQGILGIYADFRYLVEDSYYEMSEYRSDNVWSLPTPNGQRDCSDISNFRAGSELGTFEKAWDEWYKVIYDANTAIAKIQGAQLQNSTVQDQFLNEAHFLRGWAYFELVRLFGNVPVVLAPASPSAVNSIGQTDALTVLTTVVIPELEYGLNLPDKGNVVNAVGTKVPDQGRADKTAAAAMLARVYMTLAGFPYNDTAAKTEAKKYLAMVLDKKSKYWAPTINEWRKQFTPDGNNLYSVLAIQYRAGGTGNPGIFNMVKSLPPSYTNGVGVRLFGNSNFVEKTLRYEFGKMFSTGNKDLRGEGWSLLDGYEQEGNTIAYASAKETVTVDGVTDSVYSESIIYKPIPSKPKMDALGLSMDYSALKDYNDWPVNYAVIRIEDMMLLQSELLIADGDIQGGLAAVNEIRLRAGIDPVPTDVDATTALNFVKRERRLELFAEGVRWFDQVRYGTWKQEILDMFARYGNPEGTNTSDVADGRYLYPIPQNQMNIKPGLYKQNTGY
jgi:hypothetical protein